MPPTRMPTVTLITDFGTRDYFVASMKGVMMSISPQVQIIDISHEVAPQDIVEAAFLLRSCFHYFPPRTVHVVVVDPTVGSSRKPLMVASENHYFVAPDNGVLSLIEEVEAISTVVEITAEHYILPNPSNTFHGRDVFAPAAAWLTKGTDILNFGPEMDTFNKLPLPKPKMVGDSMLKGMVIHVDRFGNLITNISKEEFDTVRARVPGDSCRIVLGKQEIAGLKQFYAEGQKGELIALFGSSGLLEVSQSQGSAARALALARGAEAAVLFK
jgi:S-adenosyl-L-methionine hydrolase (adenosine-forming)